MKFSPPAILRRLWNDESGNASVIALLLITTIVAMGAVVGLASFRNQIVQEFGDVGVALESLDQSFAYEIQIDTDADGTFDQTIEGSYDDPDTTLEDPACAGPAEIMFVPAP